MRSPTRLAPLGALLLLFSACKDSPPTTEKLIEGLRTQLTGTKSYRATLATSATRQMGRGGADTAIEGKAQLTAQLPDKYLLAARSEMNGPDGKRMGLDGTILLDGTNAWVVMKMLGAPEGFPDRVLKLDQKKLAPPAAPLQIGLSMNGVGLRGGEDLVGSLLVYLEDYEFTSAPVEALFGQTPCWRVEGKLLLERILRRLPTTDPGFFASYADALEPGRIDESRRPQLLQMLNRAASGSVGDSARLSLYFTRKGRELAGWELGREGRVATRIGLERFERNVSLPADAFAPSEQAKAAEDKTADLLPGIEQARQSLSDPARVERTVAALVAVLEKELAAAPAAAVPAAPAAIAAPAVAAPAAPAAIAAPAAAPAPAAPEAAAAAPAPAPAAPVAAPATAEPAAAK